MEDYEAREGETPFRFSLASYLPISDELIDDVCAQLSALDPRLAYRHVFIPDYDVVTFSGVMRQSYSSPDLEKIKIRLQELSTSIDADCAFLMGELALTGPRLIVSDVDSTFIQQEVIELIADYAGTTVQVARITAAAMRGELDFADSLARRVSTLAGLPSSILDDVVANISLSPGAQRLVDIAHRYGAKIGLVSGGFVEVLKPLAQKCNIDMYAANRFEIRNGTLTGRTLGAVVDAETKLKMTQLWQRQLNIRTDRIVCVGDGANDLKMINYAAHGFAYRAKPILAAAADSTINHPRLDILASMFGWE
ncbi:phosphoserine phosphatase [Arcanobacterium pluranimalium]|uniref:phosphoserine phosphatase SerB n=1 Tax=Arcanobacterium pluranimalium TaxID=108028 RepID=UPI00195861D1|nr:phosphoserine phosphatase SerB [Arcanobacterium pluranimalium]MBM7825343.1 phosphoserine phosphatase [Arcanobacterium pluranimalium]